VSIKNKKDNQSYIAKLTYQRSTFLPVTGIVVLSANPDETAVDPDSVTGHNITIHPSQEKSRFTPHAFSRSTPQTASKLSTLKV
jgi:hypothetical protein